MGVTEWCWTDYPEPQSQRSGWLEAAGWIPSDWLCGPVQSPLAPRNDRTQREGGNPPGTGLEVEPGGANGGGEGDWSKHPRSFRARTTLKLDAALGER